MRSRYVDIAAKLFCVIAAIIFLWLLFEYALGIILPFAVAFCVGIPIHALSVRIHKKIGFPRRLCAFVLVLLFLTALGFIEIGRAHV